MPLSLTRLGKGGDPGGASVRSHSSGPWWWSSAAGDAGGILNDSSVFRSQIDTPSPWPKLACRPPGDFPWWSVSASGRQQAIDAMSDQATTVPRPTALQISNIPEAVIRIAGNSQDGIQAIGGFLARLA